MLSLQAAGIGAGDEVLVPAHTFIATALAVSAVGARPVLVDVDETTFNINPDCVDAAITAHGVGRSSRAPHHGRPR